MNVTVGYSSGMAGAVLQFGVFFVAAALALSGRGITAGTAETAFSPNEVCTRAQAVTFLWRAAGQPDSTVKENPFKDVKSSRFYYHAVLWAIQQGVTAGKSATKFGPNDTCTRAQIVTFLFRDQASKAPD